MLQKEMVERMSAQPGTRHYSRLSVMLQAKYSMMPLFDVPPEAFDPPPYVMSAVVRIRPLSAKSIWLPKSEAVFAPVVSCSFRQRRQMLSRVLLCGFQLLV